MLIEYVRKIKGVKKQNRIFEEIINDKRCVLLNDCNGIRTTAYKEHRGWKASTWAKTMQMANNLNDFKIPVCFLPESNTISSADAIIRYNKRWRICDFKYCISTNSNTISGELIKGFKQADTIVLKLENANLGVLRDAIEQVKRKKYYGDLLVINKRGKTQYISVKEIQSGKYLTKLRGFL